MKLSKQLALILMKFAENSAAALARIPTKLAGIQAGNREICSASTKARYPIELAVRKVAVFQPPRRERS